MIGLFVGQKHTDQPRYGLIDSSITLDNPQYETVQSHDNMLMPHTLNMIFTISYKDLRDCPISFSKPREGPRLDLDLRRSSVVESPAVFLDSDRQTNRSGTPAYVVLIFYVHRPLGYRICRISLSPK